MFNRTHRARGIRAASLMVAGGLAGALTIPAAAQAAPVISATPIPIITEFPATPDAPPGTVPAPNEVTAGPPGDTHVWYTEDNGAIGQMTYAGTATAFTNGIPADSGPLDITTGPDNNLWFTESTGDAVARLTTAGVVKHVGLPPKSEPYGIASGPDQNLWVTEAQGNAIVRISVHGVVTPFSEGLSPDADPLFITAGPNGNMWFTETNTGKIGQITTSGTVGTITERQVANPGTLLDIAAGPNESMYWTTTSEIGWITADGVIHTSTAGLLPGAVPTRITLGPDGDMWFTDSGADAIGMINSAGQITEFTQGITGSPNGIAYGPDGLWFTEPEIGKVARVTFCSPKICEPTATSASH